jgi:hypothetical protein
MYQATPTTTEMKCMEMSLVQLFVEERKPFIGRPVFSCVDTHTVCVVDRSTAVTESPRSVFPFSTHLAVLWRA